MGGLLVKNHPPPQIPLPMPRTINDQRSNGELFVFSPAVAVVSLFPVGETSDVLI